MELKQLFYFATLADTLSFSRASELLYVSQSTLSKQIAALEQELQVQLVMRNTHTVMLTEAGGAFLKEAHHVIKASELAVEAAHSVGKEPQTKELSIAIDERLERTTATTAPVVSAFNQYAREYPDTTLKYESMSFSDIWNALQNGTVDTGLMLHETDDFQHIMASSMNSVELYVDPLVLVLPYDPEEDYRKSVGELVASFDTAIIPQRHSQFSTPSTIFKRLGVYPNIRFTGSMAQILSMVSQGKGFTFIPYHNFLQLQLKGLVAVKIPGEPIRAEVVLRWRKDRHNNHIQELVGVFRENSTEMEVPPVTLPTE